MDNVTGTRNTGWQEAFGGPFGDSLPFQVETTAGAFPFQMDMVAENMPFSEEDFYAAEEVEYPAMQEDTVQTISKTEEAVIADLNENVTKKPETDVKKDLSETIEEAPEEETEVGTDAVKAEAVETAEARRRAEHEAAEAKRKAEWETRQQEKKEREQKELECLATMSDEEAMSASMKRVSKDMEKLTRRNMKECVSEHIQTLCLDDPAFARLALHPKKSMIHCFHYINRKAREFVEQEMKDNDIKPENGVYGSDVPDDLCYQWAEEYFRDPDAKEDQPEQEEKFVPKPYVGKSASKQKAKKTVEKNKSAKKPENKKAVAEAPKETTEQLSLDAFLMPETAAS